MVKRTAMHALDAFCETLEPYNLNSALSEPSQRLNEAFTEP